MGFQAKYSAMPRLQRARSPRVLAGHVLQRTVLLILVAFLVIYTVVEYFSTHRVLAQCVQLTANGAHPHSRITTGSDSNITTPEPELDSGNEVDHDVIAIPTNAEREEEASPTVGKVMMMYGKLAEGDNSRRLIDGHRMHAELQGHSFHLFDREVLDGMWSKQAWLLSVMLDQMRKSEDKRTRWLHWCDADVVLMNYNVPLDVFLPPSSFDRINLLISNDHNGLNAGSFFIRVNEWGVRFLIDILALRTYRPDEKLKYKEQSAMSSLLTQDKKYSNQTMFVPQRWFNAYRGPREGDKLVKGATVPANTIKEGDLQLHFSGGKKNKAHIPEWLDYAANDTSGWVVPLHKTKLLMEIALFWKLEEERTSWDTPVASKSTSQSEELRKSQKVEKTENTKSTEKSGSIIGADDLSSTKIANTSGSAEKEKSRLGDISKSEEPSDGTDVQNELESNRNDAD